MLIAVSSNDQEELKGQVSAHFGRCPYYTLIEVQGQEIQKVKVIENPYFRTHEPGQIPGFMRDQGVKVMLAGGMGRRAVQYFKQYDIEVSTGVSGKVADVLDRYLKEGSTGAAPCKESLSHAE
ncbi:MAG TPA: dinitrogenase iron-molybdenum cofactor biosynthesis protein [Anaerolineae bacterium]|nr:dinitrogenase iron-molybdenum cofactor biosynthesis protein [Anaerolineae bacterium]